ncbi:unnamed protein product [Ixodes persulcatus]
MHCYLSKRCSSAASDSILAEFVVIPNCQYICANVLSVTRCFEG